MVSLAKGNSSFDFSCALLTGKWELWHVTVTLKPPWLCRGFRGPTLHHSLCHQGGFPADLPRLVSHPAHSHTGFCGQDFQFCCGTFWRGKPQVPVQAQPITLVVLGELDTDGPEPHAPWLDSPGDSARAGGSQG